MRKKFFPRYCVVDWPSTFPVKLFSNPTFEILQEGRSTSKISDHCTIGEVGCVFCHFSEIMFNHSRAKIRPLLNWVLDQGLKFLQFISQDVLFIWVGFRRCSIFYLILLVVCRLSRFHVTGESVLGCYMFPTSRGRARMLRSWGWGVARLACWGRATCVLLAWSVVIFWECPVAQFRECINIRDGITPGWVIISGVAIYFLSVSELEWSVVATRGTLGWSRCWTLGWWLFGGSVQTSSKGLYLVAGCPHIENLPLRPPQELGVVPIVAMADFVPGFL